MKKSIAIKAFFSYLLSMAVMCINPVETSIIASVRFSNATSSTTIWIKMRKKILVNAWI